MPRPKGVKVAKCECGANVVGLPRHVVECKKCQAKVRIPGAGAAAEKPVKAAKPEKKAKAPKAEKKYCKVCGALLKPKKAEKSAKAPKEAKTPRGKSEKQPALTTNGKRRGRPPGSKNKPKDASPVEAGVTTEATDEAAPEVTATLA